MRIILHTFFHAVAAVDVDYSVMSYIVSVLRSGWKKLDIIEDLSTNRNIWISSSDTIDLCPFRLFNVVDFIYYYYNYYYYFQILTFSILFEFDRSHPEFVLR